MNINLRVWHIFRCTHLKNGAYLITDMVNTFVSDNYAVRGFPFNVCHECIFAIG